MPIGPLTMAERYLEAKEAVIEEGYAPEIDWQDSLSFDDVGESQLLREAAWVILSAGMAEGVIRRKFPAISTAFFHWESADVVASRKLTCRRRALSVFAHQKKIEAIITVAERISSVGYGAFKDRIRAEGIAYLQSLPYLGPATSLHLAKNLGLDVAKPDRHLLRVAAVCGFDSPQHLCRTIAQALGERIAVVDLVIWRFATLRREYLAHFARGTVSA